MDVVCEELDEANAEIEKLRAELKHKTELSENLRKAYNEQLIRNQEVRSKIEKQAQELNEKAEEVSVVKQMFEDLQRSLDEKESFIRHLSTANDKLRVDCNEKFRKWEEEKRGLVLALDEGNEKNVDQEQKINVLMAENEGLKGLLAASQRKCLEADKKAKAFKELRERDDMLVKLEEENQQVEDQLKWKKEQFQHLEEAHLKLREQFRESKKEWELEKSKLIDEIYSLQASLDSQTRISEDLQNRLKMCSQALANEESRRKYLEIELSEFKTCLENSFTECQEGRSQLACLTAQRDKEIATLRHLLGTKEAFNKEIEYRAGKLEQENQELLASIRELQEAHIQEAGNSSSLAKLRNKLRSVEQMHRDCSANLRAKEAERSSQVGKLTGELNDCRTALESKESTIEELDMEVRSCHSEIMQLKLQNEEAAVMLLVLQSGLTEAQANLENAKAEMSLRDKERDESISLFMKQLEMKNTALANALTDLKEERQKAATLLEKVESLGVVEEQLLSIQKELQRYKEMLEESSQCQLHFKEQALQTENDLKDKLRAVCDALHMANSELAKERENAASWSQRTESLDFIEEKRLLMQKELERYKEMLKESSKSQLLLEEKALHMETDLKEEIRKVCNELHAANSALAEEREKAASLSRRVEHLDLIEEQQLQMQNKLERCKDMLEDSSRCQLHLEKQALDKENKLREVCDALERVNCELAASICEGHAIEFELWIWKSIARRLKDDLEENQVLRKELEASLLAQVEVGESIKQENDGLAQVLEVKDGRINNLQLQIELFEQELTKRESETATSARMETMMSFDTEKENFLQTMKAKDKILEGLQKEIGWLEEESLRRELEGAVLAQVGAEGKFEHEKDNLIQLIEEKDQRIDDLLQFVRSLEQKFNSSLITFSSELAEKEAEISLIHEAWEKIATAEILAKLEIEEKKLMILDLEDDINSMQQRLESQEKTLSHSKQQALEIEAELEAKQLEMKKLMNLMDTKLKTSEALVVELKSENQSLFEDAKKLSSDKENLLDFIVGLSDRISQFSREDMELIGYLERLVQSLDDNGSGLILKSDSEIFMSVKENVNTCHSPATKTFQAILEERPPFRELN